MNCWILLLLLFCGSGNTCGCCNRRECVPDRGCECGHDHRCREVKETCREPRETCCDGPGMVPPPPMADFNCKYNDDCDCQKQ